MMGLPPRNSFRVYTDKRGNRRLDLIQFDGRVFPLKPPAVLNDLKPGFYSHKFEFIRPDLTADEAVELLRSKLNGVEKGYPEFNPDQIRDAQGRWSGGGATLQTTLERMLGPAYTVDVSQFMGGYELTVHSRGVHSASFFVPNTAGRTLSFESIYTTTGAEGREEFARDVLKMIHEAAVATKSTAITLGAAGVGGYVWPRLGFELDPGIVESGGEKDTVEWFLTSSGIEDRIKDARRFLTHDQIRELNSLVKAGGFDLPAKIARLDWPISQDAFFELTRGFGKTDAPTLGKALLLNTRGAYRLPASKYDLLRQWYSRPSRG